MDINLTDSFRSDITQSDCIGFDIEGLYSTDLHIRDYNLEYYMFSNPDIIIKANVFNLHKTNTLTFNTNFDHCPENTDVKTTPDSYVFSNHELLIENCISEDNYSATFYQEAVSLLDDNENTLMLIKANSLGFNGHSPFNLFDNQSELVFLLNFGGIRRCLI